MDRVQWKEGRTKAQNIPLREAREPEHTSGELQKVVRMERNWTNDKKEAQPQGGRVRWRGAALGGLTGLLLGNGRGGELFRVEKY